MNRESQRPSPVLNDSSGEYVFDFGQMKGLTIAAVLEKKPDYIAHLIAGQQLDNRPTLAEALRKAGILEAETVKANEFRKLSAQ